MCCHGEREGQQSLPGCRWGVWKVGPRGDFSPISVFLLSFSVVVPRAVYIMAFLRVGLDEGHGNLSRGWSIPCLKYVLVAVGAGGAPAQSLSWNDDTHGTGDDPYDMIHVLEVSVIRTACMSRCSALACCGRRRSGGLSLRLVVPIVLYVRYVQGRLNVTLCGRSVLGYLTTGSLCMWRRL